MNFATVFSRGGNALVPFGLTIRPTYYSAHAFGGYERAEYEVAGSLNALWDTINLLGCKVVTRNSNGSVVWMGYATEITIDTGSYRVGVSLDRMANKVRTAYSYTKLDGGQEQGTTDWASDTDSITRYGTKEKTLSVNDTNATAATAKRDTYLKKHKYPIPIVSFDTQGKPSATILCAGPWQMLEWNYYSNDLGREIYDANGSVEAMVGWQLTSSDIGFGYEKLHELYARHSAMTSGARFKVSGGLNNGRSYTVSGEVDGSVIVHVSASVSFGVADDIYDNVVGLQWAEEQEMLRVTGSASNNGVWLIKKKDTDQHIEVTPGTINAEGIGSTVTLRQGVSVNLQESVTQEMAGTSITLTSIGLKVAQSFQIAQAVGWRGIEVGCRAAIKGSPADNLRFSIYSNSGGNPNALLGSQTLANSELTNDLDWVTVQIPGGVDFAPATTYWLVVDRTGASDYDDFYTVDLNEDAGYTRGECKLWDGSSWTTPSPVLDMPFQIWGMQDTTTVIKDMLEASPYINDVRLDTVSSVLERQWRDGTLGVKSEVERLLRFGTSSGVPLIALVQENGDCIISQPSDSELKAPVFGEDRVLRQYNGSEWEQGVLPVGQYVHLHDRHPQIAFFSSISPILVESASYNADSDEMSLVPWGMYEDDDL